MTVLTIRLFGDPVLRTAAEPVIDPAGDPTLRTLVDDMQIGRASCRERV